MSAERANRVLEELVKQGVPRHRLRAAGFGTEPREPDFVPSIIYIYIYLSLSIYIYIYIYIHLYILLY